MMFFERVQLKSMRGIDPCVGDRSTIYVSSHLDPSYDQSLSRSPHPPLSQGLQKPIACGEHEHSTSIGVRVRYSRHTKSNSRSCRFILWVVRGRLSRSGVLCGDWPSNWRRENAANRYSCGEPGLVSRCFVKGASNSARRYARTNEDIGKVILRCRTLNTSMQPEWQYLLHVIQWAAHVQVLL
jgi:hypothetical protein